jgi:adenylate kinase
MKLTGWVIVHIPTKRFIIVEDDKEVIQERFKDGAYGPGYRIYPISTEINEFENEQIFDNVVQLHQARHARIE